jgi:energy-coupling factor transporter transmembrane protein EcfT
MGQKLITLLLYTIYLIVLIACCILSILFIVLAIVRRKKKTRLIVCSTLATFFIIATYFLWTIDVLSAETTDREKATVAFEENFGFKPPNSIKEIKLKNYNIYDASAHWMTFTYDSVVFNKILSHDQPLEIAYLGTQKYREINSSLKQGCANCPDWLELPNSNTSKIFFKKDFLQHSSSEYYLWINPIERRVYLEVSYFD